MATFRSAYPNIYLDIDREKALALNIPLNRVFETLQTFLGSAYVNDFNKFNRTWQVRTQGGKRFSKDAGKHLRIVCQKSTGKMIPLGSFVKASYNVGPMRVDRYNLFPTAKVLGSPAQGYSSGQALSTMEGLAARVLPTGMSYEWTNMAFQEKKSQAREQLYS